MALTSDVRPPSLKIATWIAGTLVLFLLVEALIFRSGWYNRFLEPNSYGGNVESHLFWLRRNAPVNRPEVLVIGDSRVAEGFSAKEANGDGSVPGKYYFWNAGLAGATPRVWYYFLREADPAQRRFRAIVFALNHYSDHDSYDRLADRLIDLNFVAGYLGMRDILPFASSMADPQNVRLAVFGTLLKGTVFRPDLQAFLSNIPDRMKKIDALRTNGFGPNYGYGGRDENLAGLTMDPNSKQLWFPERLSEAQRQSITETVMPVLPEERGELRRYRQLWLGKIVKRYRASGTRLVFVELPRAPLHPVYDDGPMDFIQWAGDQPRVTVAGKETFRDMEEPVNFADGLHLNRVGRLEFTARLAHFVAAALGAPE